MTTAENAGNITKLIADVAALTKTVSGVSAVAGAKLDAGAADTFWLFTCGALVFFMQCGFAMLEAGTVRAKNTRNILLKNLLDACLGALVWWAWGFGAAYDGNSNGFIGTSFNGKGMEAGANFFTNGQYTDSKTTYVGADSGPCGLLTTTGGEDQCGYNLILWFFQYVFAAAAATIVSGAVAERAQLGAYLVYTTVITGFIYPVVVHWVWSSSGWASAFNTASDSSGGYAPALMGYNDSGTWVGGGQVDFAGSGVVHMTGGVAAFVGALIIGPRQGRFDETKKPVAIAGHSSVLQVLGTFILWLGWYGFNPGSTLGISAPGYSMHAARSVVTTTLAAATGGITVCLIEKLVGSKSWDVGAVCNGILGGLVSITAGCSTLTPYMAMISGFIGGFIYYGASAAVLKLCKVDDPLDAFAVHGACGFWGCIATALFCAPEYGYGAGSGGGLVYGGGNLMAVTLAALFAEIAWVASMTAIMFLVLKMTGILRISAEMEEAGMDVSKHGGPAYDLQTGGKAPPV